jgi:hypothetical protein
MTFPEMVFLGGLVAAMTVALQLAAGLMALGVQSLCWRRREGRWRRKASCSGSLRTSRSG